MTAPHKSDLDKCADLVLAVQDSFVRVASAVPLAFEREAEFAIQHLGNSDYLRGVALKNPISIQNAVVNVSALGISLNPALKHAYLVPRKIDQKPAVCLDISYQGLIHIALESGAIEWAQAKLVYAGDTYENQGMTAPPTHQYKPFGAGNRTGKEGFLGVYVVARMSSGEYLTHELDADSVLAIMNRSESVKAGKSSPWKTDFGEMAKKTCVKQAQKWWPKNGRLAAAIEHLNTIGEGIDFAAERGAGGQVAAGQDVDMAMDLVGEAEELCKLEDDGAIRTAWGALAAKIRAAVVNGKVSPDVFTQCKAIVTERVKGKQEQDDSRTIDGEAHEVRS